jgi:hypothetical protein
MVLYLITRVRSPKPGVPKVIRLTSNPGNVGHGWHKRWFIRPTSEERGESAWRRSRSRSGARYPRKDDPTPPEQILTRQFIPAWFHDNLALQGGPELPGEGVGARRRQGEAARGGRLGRERVDDRRRVLARAASHPRDRRRAARTRAGGGIRSSRGTSIRTALAAAGRREDLRLGRLRLRRAVVVPPARDAAGRSHADVLRVL